jgi:hypothetical protein
VHLLRANAGQRVQGKQILQHVQAFAVHHPRVAEGIEIQTPGPQQCLAQPAVTGVPSVVATRDQPHQLGVQREARLLHPKAGVPMNGVAVLQKMATAAARMGFGLHAGS